MYHTQRPGTRLYYQSTGTPLVAPLHPYNSAQDDELITQPSFNFDSFDSSLPTLPTDTPPTTDYSTPMATTTTRPSDYRPGKAPLLLDKSPSSIQSYLLQLSFFFSTKDKTPADSQRIRYTGAGLVNVEELSAWFQQDLEQHITSKWDDFLAAFLVRAMPPDFVWERRMRIRESKQGSKDVREWMTEMRSVQLEVGTGALSDVRLVEGLLFNMDPELRRELRRDAILKGTGLTESEMDTLGLARRLKNSLAAPAVNVDSSTATTASTKAATVTPPTPVIPAAFAIDFPAFERRAHELWQLISSRRADAVAAATSIHWRGVS